MNNEKRCEDIYKDAMRNFRDLQRAMQNPGNGSLMKKAGHDSGEPVTEDEVELTARAVRFMEDAVIAAQESFENLEKLYALMKRMKEDQEAEVITDEDQHPGINKASTWVNPRGDYP